ncbi:MAG: hypothetical protein ACRCXT_01780 [Paraclostridium sp.]
MGNGSTISCSKCSYERNIMLGIGMCYYGISGVFDKYKELKEKYIDISDRVSEEVHICNECNFWDTITSVKFVTDDFIYTYRHNCPNCNSYNLKLTENTILWD